MDATRGLLGKEIVAEIPDFEDFGANLHRFEEFQHASGYAVEEVMSSKRATLSYDIAAWIEAGFPRDVSIFKLPQPAEFEWRLSEEGHRGLGATLQVWGVDLKALTK